MFITSSPTSGINAAGDFTGRVTTHLQWGLMLENFGTSIPKEISAFTSTADELFFVADNESVTIIDNGKIKQNIQLSVTAMVYIERINQVIACVDSSPQLRFIWTRYPYRVRRHPLHFATRTIKVMKFFPESSILVCAGNGIFLSHMTIPGDQSHPNPMPETLQFEKIAELYNDMTFNFHNQPVVSVSEELIFIHIDDKIFVHDSHGNKIRTFQDDMFNKLTALNIDEKTKRIIVATEKGEIAIFPINDDEYEDEVIALEDIESLLKCNFPLNNIMYSYMYDYQFMVVVSKEQSIALLSIPRNQILSIDKMKNKPKVVIAGGKHHFIFFEYGMLSYYADIFTVFFKNVGKNYKYMKRCPSLPKAARFFMIGNDSTVTFTTVRTNKVITELGPVNQSNNIAHAIYPRDTMADGNFIVTSNINDSAFVLLSNGNLIEILFDAFERKGLSKGNANDVLKSINGYPLERFTTTMISTPPDLKFQTIVKIDSSKMPSCVCCVCESGLICLFSTSTKSFFSMFNTNIGNVLTAIYSFQNQLLVVSCIGQLFTLDLLSQKVKTSTVGCTYTSLIMINDVTLACGGVAGNFDIREFPSLRFLASGTNYGVSHTRRGNPPTSSIYTEAQKALLTPYAISQLDYCAPRGVVMSFSRSGEIFIWGLNAFPIVHIDMGFEFSSACFINGKGGILISAFDSLFKIKSSVLFDKNLIVKASPLDDFDLRCDAFDDSSFNFNSVTKSIGRVNIPSLGRRQYKKRVKIILDSSDDDIGWNQKEEEQINPIFNDLETLVDPIPKRYMAPIKERFRLVLKARVKESSAIVEERLRIQQEEEEKERQRRKKPKKIKSKARKKHNSPEKKDQKQITVSKRSSSKRPEMKSTKSLFGKSLPKQKYNEFVLPKSTSKVSLSGESLFDRLNSEPKKRRSEKAQEICPISPTSNPTNILKIDTKRGKFTAKSNINSKKNLLPSSFPTSKSKPDFKKLISEPLEEKSIKSPRSVSNSKAASSMNTPKEPKEPSLKLKTKSASCIDNFNARTSAERRSSSSSAFPSTNKKESPRSPRKNSKEKTRSSSVSSGFEFETFNGNVHQPDETESDIEIARSPRRAGRHPSTPVYSSASSQASDSFLERNFYSPDVRRSQKFRREPTIDSQMFSMYRIDGFQSPFGGFEFGQESDMTGIIEDESELIQLDGKESMKLLRVRRFDKSSLRGESSPPLMRITATNMGENVLVDAASLSPQELSATMPMRVSPRKKLKKNESKPYRNISFKPAEPFTSTIIDQDFDPMILNSSL